jgi:hypothetical protein
MSADRAPIRILSVDDHRLLRAFASQLDMMLVAEASNGCERSNHAACIVLM